MNEVKNIIVIGASAGGINSVSRLLSGISADIDAALFVVIHLSVSSRASVIIDTFQKHTDLDCKVAIDNLKIENHTVYLAPPDHQLLIEKDSMKVQKGAHENHYRPSIDVLFRSAAAIYSSCVTGIILTGMLDDGASGMSAIKRSGGVCIVQDLKEAQFPDMPANVLQAVQADHQVGIHEMAKLINERFAVPKVCIPGPVPDDIIHEASITRRMSSSISQTVRLGEITPFTCPDCGGVLSYMKDDPVERYRCYTGHTFTEEILLQEQYKHIEEALWVSIRMMEERRNLLETISRKQVDSKLERAMTLDRHILVLKKMLRGLESSGELHSWD